jgi:hypothetical protein
LYLRRIFANLFRHEKKHNHKKNLLTQKELPFLRRCWKIRKLFSSICKKAENWGTSKKNTALLSPYPLQEADDLSYRFTSYKGIIYHVYFLD